MDDEQATGQGRQDADAALADDRSDGGMPAADAEPGGPEAEPTGPEAGPSGSGADPESPDAEPTGPDARPSAPSDVDPAPDAPRLLPALALYSALRVGLLVVLTVLLMVAGRPFGLPLIVALAFAVVLQLPLSVLLFPKQRRTLTAALAHAKSHRTAERDRLRAALTGEDRTD